MGTRAGFTTDYGMGESTAGVVMPLPGRKPQPMLVGLAIAGWATFAVQWIFVIVLIIGRGGSPNTVTVAQADTTPPRTSPPASQPITRPPTSAVTPTPTQRPAPSTRPATVTPTPQPVTPAADPNNPFLALRPNALGMDLNSGHTVILIDAVQQSSGWLDDGKAALIAGLTRPARGQTASLLTIRDGEIDAYSGNPLIPGSGQLTGLARFFNPLDTQGKGGLGAGLDAAVATGADEIIFLTSRASRWGGYLETVERKLTPDGRRVKLSVVSIGGASEDLREFVRAPRNGGRFTQISPQQLKAWRDAAG